MLQFAFHNISFSLKPIFQVTWSLLVGSSVTEGLQLHTKYTERLLFDVYKSFAVIVVFDLGMLLESNTS